MASFRVELGRKVVHFTSIFILLIYILIGQYSHRLALLTLTLILVILIELEFIRLEAGKRSKIMAYLAKYRRDKERNHMGGEVFFMIGAILCLAIFDFRIAIAAILMTTFGDMAAALVGRKFGRHKFPRSKKTWEGSLAGFIVNMIIGWLFVRQGALWFLEVAGLSGEPLWSVIIIMALTASIVELLINKLDDNLLIPLFSGFNGQIMLLIMNISIITL